MKNKVLKTFATSIFAFTMALGVITFSLNSNSSCSVLAEEEVKEDETTEPIETTEDEEEVKEDETTEPVETTEDEEEVVDVWTYNSETKQLSVKYPPDHENTRCYVKGVTYVPNSDQSKQLLIVKYFVYVSEELEDDEGTYISWSLYNVEYAELSNAVIVNESTKTEDGLIRGYFDKVESEVELIVPKGVIIYTRKDTPEPTPEPEPEPAEDKPSEVKTLGKHTIKEILIVIKNTLRDAFKDVIAHLKRWFNL